RSFERNLHAVPVVLLAEAGELLVAGVEPENGAAKRFRRHTMYDDADEFTGFAASDVHLVAGAQIHAAVVEARLVLAGVRLVGPDDFRGAARAVFGQHEVELELDILELRLRDEAAAALTRRRLAADDDAVLHCPTHVGRVLRRRAWRRPATCGNDPAAKVVAVEQRLPVA